MPSGRGCKHKGDKFERELAAWFNTILFGGAPRVFRAPLSGGGVVNLATGGSDLLGLPLCFVEAKRVEKLNFHDAMRQACGNAKGRGGEEWPVVINRRNGQALEDGLVVMRVGDWTDMLGLALKQKGYRIEMAGVAV
jgi:hypothetical protein